MRLALGTAQFGMKYGISNVSGKVSQEDGKAILKYASSSGIDTIDTAMAYGDSEHVLGNIGVEAFKIVTKLPEIPSYVTDIGTWVVDAVEESVARLGVESLYGLLLHRPGQLFDSRGVEVMSALMYLKGTGVVKKLGVSVFSPSELDALFTLYDFDIVQSPFNLVDRRLLNSGWLAKLKGAGVEVHTRSSFLQGLLLMPRDTIPQKFHAWRLLWDKWHVWLQRHQSTPVEACISYALSCLEIDRVIVGVDTQDQLTEIVHAASSVVIDSYPDIKCGSTELINPANWAAL